MVFAELKNFYEVLDVKPDATATDIRSAYLRAKNAFQRDSAALYSIVGDIEREDILARVEEAYRVLSDLSLRKEYDRSFERLQSGGANVVSIDRTPPMEMTADESLLVAPKTDEGASDDFFANAVAGTPKQTELTTNVAAPVMAPVAPPPASSAQPPPPAPAPAPEAQSPKAASPAIEQEILEQTEWSGAFLRRVRESKVLSFEEITRETRIPKNYIIALEEEDFDKLPAPVYIRGFITQLARLLKLPVNPVVQSYMSRMRDAFPEKFR